MSIVIALKKPWGVYLGADTCLSTDHYTRTFQVRKLARTSWGAVGWVGDAASADALLDWLVNTRSLSQAMRDLPRSRGVDLVLTDGRTLRGVRDRVRVKSAQYLVLGSGEPIALGALHATRSVRAALQACADISPGCAAPFEYLRVRPE